MAGEHQQTDADADEVLVARTESGPPPWELRYDESGKATIQHLHGATRVPVSVVQRGDGDWVGQCSECEASLELAGASKPSSR